MKDATYGAVCQACHSANLRFMYAKAEHVFYLGPTPTNTLVRLFFFKCLDCGKATSSHMNMAVCYVVDEVDWLPSEAEQ